MSILYAYMSQPHYELWSKKEDEQGRIATKELFMKEFGTPLVTFSADGREGFHPLNQGSSIIINFQYYNDLNKKFETLSFTQEEKCKEDIHGGTFINKSVGGFFDKVTNWITSRLHL